MKCSLIGLLLVALGGTLPAAELPVVRIGIAIDGPRQPSKETLRDSLLPHIRELTQAKFDVRFPADKMIMADGSVAGVKAALDELLQDDEVDLLIAAGAICGPRCGAAGAATQTGDCRSYIPAAGTGCAFARGRQRRQKSQLYFLRYRCAQRFTDLSGYCPL